MTKPRDPDALLSAYLDVGMEVLPDRVVDAVLDEVRGTRQRTVIGPRRTRSMSRTTLAAAAVAALLVVGGALLYERGLLEVAAPSPTAQASGSPSQPAVVTATPTPTAEVLSLDLAWTEVDIEASPGNVAWLGDRFVLVDSSGAVRTSIDGTSWEVLQPGDPDPGYAELLNRWAVLQPRNPDPDPGDAVFSYRASIVSWEDQIVGWSNPEDDGHDTAGEPPITARDVLRIVQPPAPPTVTTPFEGRIQSIGIGPAGIVALVLSDLHEYSSVWFSTDGIEWTAIPADFQDVVGVSDGFIASGETPKDTCTLPDGCSSMWHSSDGLTWRNLGHPEADPEAYTARLVPWEGGALVTDRFGTFGLWTSQGYSELPMGADFPAEEWYEPIATGPLGLVSIRRGSMEILVTRNGVDWKTQPMPAAMVTVSDGQIEPTIAVGDRSVLYLTWSGYRYEGEGYIPHLWVGSVEP